MTRYLARAMNRMAIGRKLNVVIMLVCSSTLLLVMGALVVFDWRSVRGQASVRRDGGLCPLAPDQGLRRTGQQAASSLSGHSQAAPEQNRTHDRLHAAHSARDPFKAPRNRAAPQQPTLPAPAR